VHGADARVLVEQLGELAGELAGPDEPDREHEGPSAATI
jgi:hypothetical protein